MEDALISFETAKLAKEKGFNIPQNKVYSFGKEMFGYIDKVKFLNGDKQECSSNPHDWNNTKSPTSTKYYSAPTQSLLAKWLREVYKLSVNIISKSEKLHFCIIVDYKNKKAIDVKGEKDYSFKSYEKSLEKGLQEALKLIK